MTTALAYPSTRYDPAPHVDLSEPAERERLSPASIRVFFRIMNKWNVRDEDARRLLGGMSNGTFYAMKKKPIQNLDEDKLRRISYLVGIFKALNILHGEMLADRWMTLPNKNRIFSGVSPVEYLIRGGLPAFQTVRRLLDARRGGL
ncbi:MAG: antitoxin Xre/MbcA/ParS toxin-binding domain-containing protein [Geminicoccaceae bacterium]